MYFKSFILHWGGEVLEAEGFHLVLPAVDQLSRPCENTWQQNNVLLTVCVKCRFCQNYSTYMHMPFCVVNKHTECVCVCVWQTHWLDFLKNTSGWFDYERDNKLLKAFLNQWCDMLTALWSFTLQIYSLLGKPWWFCCVSWLIAQCDDLGVSHQCGCCEFKSNLIWPFLSHTWKSPWTNSYCGGPSFLTP